MNVPTVRHAVPSDIAELARLRWDSRVEDHEAQSRSDFVDACEAWLRGAMASDRWPMAVAETEPGSLCGCMFLEYVLKVPAPGATERAWGYVTNSFVETQHRGRGVGERLMELLIKVAHDRRLEFLLVWPSAAAVTFYKRAGFQPVSQAHAGPGDEAPLEMVL